MSVQPSLRLLCCDTWSPVFPEQQAHFEGKVAIFILIAGLLSSKYMLCTAMATTVRDAAKDAACHAGKPGSC